MLHNYLTIAFRNLLRHKAFSFINIFGLAIGMAACLLILQYVSFQLSYDTFHKQTDHIYRIKQETYQNKQLSDKNAGITQEFGPALQAEFPEVQTTARVATWEGVVAASGSGGLPLAFNERKVFFTDASFFHVFSFPLLKGSDMVLNEPNSVIITAHTASKYFGKQDPIGKVITLENHNQGHYFTATVKGVCKDAPVNSHLQFDFLVSLNTFGEGQKGWSVYTYVLLQPNANPQVLETKLPGLVEKYMPAKQADNGAKTVLSLQPLSSIYLYSDLTDEISAGGNGKLIWFLALIAVLILFIAYMNYVNLSTTKSIDRAKEVGIRKVLGSQRWHLIKQFFLESSLLNLLSLVLALVFVRICTNWSSEFSGIPMSFLSGGSYTFWLVFSGLLLLGTLLSGIYPALILSAYQPIHVLKGQFRKTSQGMELRKWLMVLQFVISLALMVGTFAIYQQVTYMRSKNLGMNMAQTLVVAAPQDRRENEQEEKMFYQRLTTFQTEVRRHPAINSLTPTSGIPGVAIDWYPRYFPRADAANEEAVQYATLAIGPEFIDQFQIKVVAGEKFSVERANSISKANRIPILLNQMAVEALGFKNPEAAIGQFIYNRNGAGKTFTCQIVGVIQNFHDSSLKYEYKPLVFRFEEGSSIKYYALKINVENVAQTVAQIEEIYQNLFSGSPFEYFFLDEYFNEQYKADQQFGQIFGLFSSLAIFVSCLGLFGLVSFTTSQRTKEIGVRKVLGASVADILALLTKNFMKLILLSNLIAWPIAYWGVYEWLQSYAFRIQIDLWLFVLPSLLILLISLLTMSVQTWWAANSNPVKSLRNE